MGPVGSRVGNARGLASLWSREAVGLRFCRRGAEYGNAETSVAPSGMIRRRGRGIDSGRSVALSGMIRQRERQEHDVPISRLTLTLVCSLLADVSEGVG